ncbi:hypothetical protein [Dermatophilus congolensis]|uniref:hypothetical protein n=1 Tax=Dermatophilus congolensis TaxID=1863 RepID=UPI001AB04AB4|nr:hypothetical protein [Dermatophilus congolensis]MBO3141993.1 hypothetical protein [Dermatophilus congolensis]
MPTTTQTPLHLQLTENQPTRFITKALTKATPTHHGTLEQQNSQWLDQEHTIKINPDLLWHTTNTTSHHHITGTNITIHQHGLDLTADPTTLLQHINDLAHALTTPHHTSNQPNRVTWTTQARPVLPRAAPFRCQPDVVALRPGPTHTPSRVKNRRTQTPGKHPGKQGRAGRTDRIDPFPLE